MLQRTQLSLQRKVVVSGGFGACEANTRRAAGRFRCVHVAKGKGKQSCTALKGWQLHHCRQNTALYGVCWQGQPQTSSRQLNVVVGSSNRGCVR